MVYGNIFKERFSLLQKFNDSLSKYDLRFCWKCRKFKNLCDFNKKPLCCLICKKKTDKVIRSTPKYKAMQKRKWNRLYSDPEYKKKCGDKRLIKLYGITPEKYEEILEEQNYSCAICKIHKNHFVRKLQVDHNHTTGKVRGLLCHRCNTSLGKLYEAKCVLLQMISYITKNEEKSGIDE
jgi:hypothetical protein